MPPDRPRLHHGDRALGGEFRRHHAAVGAHDRQRAAESDIAEARFQATNITTDLGADIGVHHRGRDALEFAVFAQDFVRQRQIGIGQQGADDLAGDPLMLGIGIGVQEAHRDRFHALLGQKAAGLLDAGAPQRRMHVAGRKHALVRFACETARHQRAMLVEQQVVSLGAIATADRVDVASAAVTIRPVAAPLRSIKVLIAMVEP